MSAELLIVLAAGVFGAIVAKLIRLPMWSITGSLLGSAAAHIAMAISVDFPYSIAFTAQVLIGTAIGASILPGFLAKVGRLIFPASVIVAALVGVGLSSALVLSHLDLIAAPEAFIGMVPGGVGEMVAAAAALERNSALVAGIHIVRLLITLWTLPLIIRWATSWKRYGETDGSETY